jgi:hypothetical protein
MNDFLADIVIENMKKIGDEEQLKVTLDTAG